jgi:hypothetical protein
VIKIRGRVDWHVDAAKRELSKKNCMRIAHGFKLPSTLFEAKKIWHVVLLVYVIVHGLGILLMCVTFCSATDSILLLYVMKGDKTCTE